MGYIFMSIIVVIFLSASWLAGIFILGYWGYIKQSSDLADESILTHLLAIIVGAIPATIILGIFMFDFESSGMLKP